MKVEKVKAIVQSLHASEYVNSNGQPKKFLGIHLPSHLNSKVRDNTALLRAEKLTRARTANTSL